MRAGRSGRLLRVRPLSALGVVGLVAATVLAAAVPGTAQRGTAPALSGCGAGTADFNGDGCFDLVVADPDATVAGQARAGRLTVTYGTGVWGVLAQGQSGIDGVPEAGDRFGSVVRAAWANNDYFADLVVATPAEDVGSATDAGIIQVIFGSADGLGASRPSLTLRQGLHGIPGTPESGDRFGVSLAIDTTEGESVDPALAIGYGAPGEDIGSVLDAGTAGLVTFDHETGEVAVAGAVSQNSTGVSGSTEVGDRFGAAVEVFEGPGGFGCGTVGLEGYTLVVGTPGEDLGSVPDAGMIHLIRDLSSDATLSQDSPGVSGVAETGDQFGATLALASFCEHDGPSHVTLAVGVPAEDIGSLRDAGAAYLFRGEDQLPPPQQWSISQDTEGVEGTAEAGDRFGAVVAHDDWWHEGFGQPTVVSVPGEDIGAATDTGAAQVFGTLGTGPGDGDIFLDQAAVGESPETGDRFGAALLMGYVHLYIGAPDDATYPTGVVHGISWSTLSGIPAPHLRFAPGIDGAPTGASRFGAGLA